MLIDLFPDLYFYALDLLSSYTLTVQLNPLSQTALESDALILAVLIECLV